MYMFRLGVYVLFKAEFFLAIGVVEKSKVSMHAIVEASSSNNIISSSLSREDQVVLPTDNLSPSKGSVRLTYLQRFYIRTAFCTDQGSLKLCWN